MKTLFTMKDIAKAASVTVSDYLKEGYIIHPATGKTIFSDFIFQIDLIRGCGAPKTVRIGLRSVDRDRYDLEVREFDGDGKAWGRYYSENKSGRLIRSVKLYCVAQGAVYTTSEEEYEEIKRKRIARAKRDYFMCDNGLSENGGWCKACLKPEQVLGRVRRVPGYKRTKAEDIRYVGRTYPSGGEVCSYFVQFKRQVSSKAELTLYNI